MTSPIEAIVLAAGLASRHPDKLVHPVDGSPAVVHVVRQLLDAGLKPLVVLGHQAERIETLLKSQFADAVRLITNDEYASGMASSIRAGVLACDPQASAYLIHLADKPFVRTETITSLIGTWQAERPGILVPEYHGMHGHPAIFSHSMRDALLGLTGDSGASRLLREMASEVRRWKTGDIGVTLDLDEHLERPVDDMPVIWIRGAGELASGVAVTLTNVGFNVVMSELDEPLAIRRTVCFSDVMVTGDVRVENVLGTKIGLDDLIANGFAGRVDVIRDVPELIVEVYRPEVMVDARMIKQPFQLRDYAPITIGLGPGFVAGEHCDAVIETKRGHNLGAIIWSGPAAANTGVPGTLGGQNRKRVLHAPEAGTVEWQVNFGDLVDEGETMGQIGQSVISAPFAGIVRGLISPQTPVEAGTKIADVDPRGASVDVHTISDKSRAIGRAVLEAILILRNRQATSPGDME